MSKTTGSKLSMLLSGPFLSFSNLEEGGYFPQDQGGPITRKEWEHIRLQTDIFYSRITDEEITELIEESPKGKFARQQGSKENHVD